MFFSIDLQINVTTDYWLYAIVVVVIIISVDDNKHILYLPTLCTVGTKYTFKKHKCRSFYICIFTSVILVWNKCKHNKSNCQSRQNHYFWYYVSNYNAHISRFRTLAVTYVYTYIRITGTWRKTKNHISFRRLNTTLRSDLRVCVVQISQPYVISFSEHVISTGWGTTLMTKW